MTVYITRLLIMPFVILIFFLILKKLYTKYYKFFNNTKVYIILFIVTLFSALSINIIYHLPYEKWFNIEFCSAKDSTNYIFPRNTILEVIEGSDYAFVILLT